MPRRSRRFYQRNSGFFSGSNSGGGAGRVESKLSDYLSGRYGSSNELSTSSEGARSESPSNECVYAYDRTKPWIPVSTQ